MDKGVKLDTLNSMSNKVTVHLKLLVGCLFYKSLPEIIL